MKNPISEIFEVRNRETILSLQNKLFDTQIDFETYLKQVFDVFNQSFWKYFTQKIIFHKIYYIENENYSENYKSLGFDSYYENNPFLGGVLELESKIIEGKANSFVELVVSKYLRGLHLYKSKNNKTIKIPKFFHHSFNETNVDFNTLLGVEKDKNYIELVEKYKIISNNYDECFIYVVRTRNYDTDFNGVIFLVLSKSLLIDEYADLVDWFTFVMAAKTKYEYKKALKDAEWKKIIEQITHSKYNQRAVINNNSAEFLKKLKSLNSDSLVEYFETNEEIRKSIDKIDDFFFALNKVEYNKSKLDTLGQERIKELLKIENLSLGMILSEQLSVLQKSIDLIPFQDKNTKKNIKTILPNFKKQVFEKFKNIKINAVKEGFNIIILDLLKNAVKEVNSINPKIDIQLYPLNKNEVDEWILNEHPALNNEEMYYCLSFTNNKPIVTLNREIYDTLLGKSTNVNTSTTRQLGVRIIKQITRYDGLGKTGSKWYYTPSKECLDCIETKILLIIPKSDFDEKVL